MYALISIQAAWPQALTGCDGAHNHARDVTSATTNARRACPPAPWPMAQPAMHLDPAQTSRCCRAGKRAQTLAARMKEKMIDQMKLTKLTNKPLRWSGTKASRTTVAGSQR